MYAVINDLTDIVRDCVSARSHFEANNRAIHICICGTWHWHSNDATQYIKRALPASVLTSGRIVQTIGMANFGAVKLNSNSVTQWPQLTAEIYTKVQASLHRASVIAKFQFVGCWARSHNLNELKSKETCNNLHFAVDFYARARGKKKIAQRAAQMIRSQMKKSKQNDENLFRFSSLFLRYFLRTRSENLIKRIFAAERGGGTHRIPSIVTIQIVAIKLLVSKTRNARPYPFEMKHENGSLINYFRRNCEQILTAYRWNLSVPLRLVLPPYRKLLLTPTFDSRSKCFWCEGTKSCTASI